MLHGQRGSPGTASIPPVKTFRNQVAAPRTHCPPSPRAPEAGPPQHGVAVSKSGRLRRFSQGEQFSPSWPLETELSPGRRGDRTAGRNPHPGAFWPHGESPATPVPLPPSPAASLEPHPLPSPPVSSGPHFVRSPSLCPASPRPIAVRSLRKDHRRGGGRVPRPAASGGQRGRLEPARPRSTFQCRVRV